MVVVQFRIVLNGLLQLNIANVLDELVVAIPEKSSANVKPDVHKEILPSLCEALAKTGEVSSFNNM